MTEERELIRVEKVFFSYDSHTVLENISFSIGRGDFLALIGPNGSGKTTLVKIIIGLLRPTQGRVLISGEPVEDFTDWSIIGYVPQKATHIDPLFPVSAREVVAMALFSSPRLSWKRMRKEEKAIDKALQQVGMEDYKHFPIGKLSGGQQQRVFIARAIANNPRLLFLDEPTTGVDAPTQERFYEMLNRLNKEHGITIVLVTHDIGIITRHVNKVACLNQKLVYHGTHEDFCRSESFKIMLAGGHLVSHTH